MTNQFLELAKVDVSDRVKKKQSFTYLSWSYAVHELLSRDPQATWEYRDPMVFADGSMMVFCSVTAFGKTMTAQMPVLNLNKAITNPSSMQVNTAMMRALTKAIALHGLALYIYQNEDLPLEDEDDLAESLKEYISKIDTSKSATELRAVFAEGYALLKKHKSLAHDLKTSYDNKKGEFDAKKVLQ